MRCREVCDEADVLRYGRRSEIFFHRALDMVGAKLMEEEANLLIKRYTDHREDGLETDMMNSREKYEWGEGAAKKIGRHRPENNVAVDA